ncbi:MAG: PKD domain-containing protein [Saprospiraceae bacterium]
MKIHPLLWLLLLPAFFLGSGCQDDDFNVPAASTVANFEYTVTNEGYAPCEVTFTNLSLNATGYHWDFGNGQTSTEANPTVTYTSSGLFVVTLTCTPPNQLYYNQLVKTAVINVKDTGAGAVQVLYYTSRGTPGNGHLVILDDGPPLVQDFVPLDMNRPYGITVDTANRKVYVSDYLNETIYRFDPDGKNAEKILDASVPGQEIVGDAQGMFVLGDKLYWGRTGGIYRCNLDGTDPEVFINTGGNPPEYPIDMQYEPATGKIYLVNDKTDYSGGFWSVNFDGTGLTQIIPDVDGTALEMDFVNNKAYLVLYGSAGTVAPENGVFMCNFDGSDLTQIGDYGSKATWGITIDYERNKLFWGHKISNADPDGKIIRANLDGSNPEDWLTGVSPHAMAVVWIRL